jgi:HAD superfamily hydrolase (TIGR01490 family)
MERKEVQEAEELKEVKEQDARVAAFFDLDGTLVARPSMEKRLFGILRYRRLIGIRNYFWWLVEAVRLAPRGIIQMMHANKMYLRGVRVSEAYCGPDVSVRRCAKREEGKTGERRRQARMPVPPFYPEAIERVMWHAERGHWIVILSGTLEPLAERAACVLEAELGTRGWMDKVRVCATRLEEKHERWTGRIVGEAMIGDAKARAVKQIAVDAELDLERCFAYGDSSSDWWMLEAVGRPAAVNPSKDLAQIAFRNRWPVLRWDDKRISTQSSQSLQRKQNANATRQEVQIVSAKSGCWT